MSNEKISMEDILDSAKLEVALSEWKNIREKAKEFCVLECLYSKSVEIC